MKASAAASEPGSCLLNLLASLFQDQETRSGFDILWHQPGNMPDITSEQLRQDAAALKDKLSRYPADTWLLYSVNPYRFLLGFAVLLGMQKKIVISASNKPAWLQTLSGEFDAVLSDEVTDVSQNQGDTAIPVVDFTLTAMQQSARLWQPRYAGDERIVFYTSGSTGLPKAIAKSLLALTNETSTLFRTFAKELEGAVFISSVSHLHIYGLLFNLLLPLLARGSCISELVEYHEQILALSIRYPTVNIHQNLVFISSPTFLSRLDPQLPPMALRAIFSSGGPLSFASAGQSQCSFLQLPIEVYGSTETGGIGYRQQLVATSPWVAFSGVELTVVEDGVQLRSPNMPGQSPYLLDDQVDISPDGSFRLKGRKDRLVKLGEKRVSLTEIENFLESHETVMRCVALPLAARRPTIGCAIVLSECGHAIQKQSGQRGLVTLWKTAMQSRFDAVVLPRQWRILAEIPVTTQNKIDSSQLLAVFANPRKTC